MLYVLLAAVTFVVTYSSVDCSSYETASDCLNHIHCGWKLHNQTNCGKCESHKNCESDAVYDCALKCNINDVPNWARDDCSESDGLTCSGSACNATLRACLKNTNCYQLANATNRYESKYASEAGCYYKDEQCKNENQVYLKALNASLSQYCWGQDNAVACSLYENAVSCVAHNCSSCNDCADKCETYIVSCLFDASCSVALTWLVGEIDSFANSSDPFFPYELEADKDAYCSASGTSQYCNSKFNSVWNCLSENCLYQRCLYSTCNTQTKACYEDQGCQEQLMALLNKYPVLDDLTPGIFQSLANYYCKTDKTLSCDNSHFTALLNCYGSECCWDTDVCTQSNGLKDCDHPDCLKEACVEVNCLPDVQACLNDITGCGNAVVGQADWLQFCDNCMSNGNSAQSCSMNSPVNCSAMDNSSAILYLQQYCWKHGCSSKLTDLVQCSLIGCADCNITDFIQMATGSPSTTSILSEYDPCTCTLHTCWDALSTCFLDETCWDLFFSDKPGYGIQNLTGLFLNNSTGIASTLPSYINSQIQNVYCANKNCNQYFWNVLWCVLSPIYLGDDYYPGCSDADYFQDKITGCGVAELVYTEAYPKCITTKCFGFLNDCGASINSSCYKTLESATTNQEWNNCNLCNNCDSCYNGSATFKNYYLTRCGNDGSSCTTGYDNLANCVYRECTGGQDTLPGSKSTACTTSSASMHSGMIALIFSALLFFLSL